VTATAEFADEVVTQALVRYVNVPGVDGDIALITLENGHDHTRPSTFGPAGLTSLNNALDEIEARAPGVRAIAVTGKPFIFAVGADISGIPRVTDRSQALQIGQLGHQVFARLKNASVPTFAFVNGAAMGGGLEIALHAQYRTLSSGAAALALPECFLGLVPGWGGTQLLPNLIGADKAVTVIIENALSQNRMLKAKQAFELGIADAMFEPADFIERSLLWAAGVLRGDITVERPEIDRGQAWDDALARGKAIADARVHGAAPAPYRALELIALAKTATFEEGTAAEDETLADLVMSEELRAGLYSFDLVQKRAKRPVGVPDKSLARPVTKVGVVGAGLMASQLALLFARRLQVPVVLTDLDQDRLDKGVAFAHAEIDKLQVKRRISADAANRLKALITGSLTKDAFADADFVIEAVFENLKVKKQVFAEVEAVVKPEAILATNTSSLSVTEMAADLQHPERVVGFHFFNPVAVMPLLEIAKGAKTDDATYATAFAVGKALKKTCIAVKDAPAFVANRLFMRFFNEVTRGIDEGAPFEVADHAFDPLGLPMTPLQLLTFSGPAVSYHVMETLHTAFPDRFYLSENLGKLVAAGITSFFGPDGKTPPEILELYKQGEDGPSAEEILQRAVEAMADEVRRLLDEGVVAEPQDIDLALITGGGYPFHLGGITPYLDRTGVSEKVTGKRFLPKGIATLP
jgi:3-hydroxyacyl-CoA dehydrogenase/enoyl-CoA hydratase/carnithine racemase